MDLEQLLGRKTAQYENLQIEYRKLIEITAKLASGELPPEAVTVDFANQSWSATIPQVEIDTPAVAEAVADAPGDGAE